MGEAFEVHGAIFDAYLARGTASGPLGFPITDVHEDDPGFERSDFEHGALRLNVSTGEVEQIGAPANGGDDDPDF